MKLLVFGETGQVATALRAAGPARGHEMTALGRAAADLGDPAACAARIAASEADAVINAAAYTAVDRAEAEVALAEAVNAHAPGAMAAAAAAKGVPFLHISTDYVFPGTGARPWREDDPAEPLGVYGRTKRAGEEAVLAAGGAAVILRTAWVFSATGSNFAKTMLRLGAERDHLRIVADQRGGPTPAASIAEALLTIAEAYGAGRGTGGIFHFAGSPATTWADFAEAIFAEARLTPQVERIPTTAYPTPAARPLNSVLDCTKIAEAYGIAQPDWRTALAAILKELATA
ncbi:MAG: dTDP-4-dehydrorhamnose reductase [Pseudomonadota bacterium]